MVRPKRFELLAYRFVACCSIQLSYERVVRMCIGETCTLVKHFRENIFPGPVACSCDRIPPRCAKLAAMRLPVFARRARPGDRTHGHGPQGPGVLHDIPPQRRPCLFASTAARHEKGRNRHMA